MARVHTVLVASLPILIPCSIIPTIYHARSCTWESYHLLLSERQLRALAFDPSRPQTSLSSLFIHADSNHLHSNMRGLINNMFLLAPAIGCIGSWFIFVSVRVKISPNHLSMQLIGGSLASFDIFKRDEVPSVLVDIPANCAQRFI